MNIEEGVERPEIAYAATHEVSPERIMQITSRQLRRINGLGPAPGA